ncbi:MAG: glycosyltransferase [bacterium]
MTAPDSPAAPARSPFPFRVCFMVPTYNEASNITPLLARLAELYPGDETAFLIVDDESPDGTAQQVREFAARDPRVHLLSGARRGLGSACARGIAHALDALRAEVVVQMDADFSHDPAQARALLQCIADGADVAIGSRYVAGGAVDARWHPARRSLSRWGNRLARWIAGLSSVRDCTAGFKAMRAQALRDAGVGDIRVQGYAFQVALLHRLIHAGARVVEAPIYFREREHGQTKLGARDLLEFFYHIWWLRLASHRTFIKFALTGLSGVFVNIGSFQMLLALGLHKYLASPIAIELSILSNFLLNNHWTFAERAMVGRKRVRGLKYNLVSVVTLLLSYSTFIALSMLFPQASPALLQGCGIVPAMLFNYFLNSYWTFREAES